MSFAEINDAIKASGGEYVNLKTKGQKVQGKVLAVEVRDKVFKGNVVLVANGANKGKPRKEWLFTLETADGNKKWAAPENGQFAIRGALDGRKIEKGGLLQVEIVESSEQGSKQAEYKVIYTEPVADNDSVFQADGNDEPPF